MNNTFGAPVVDALPAPSYSWYSYLDTATATGTITDSTAQDDIPKMAHQQVN